MVVTPKPDRVLTTKPKVEVEAEDMRKEDKVSSKESDTMPSTTRLKYSRFKGDGSTSTIPYNFLKQDVRYFT